MMCLSFPLHVLAALVMGSMIGLERQWRQHNAGLRTNSLVAFGAALFVGLSTLLDQDASPSRIAAQQVANLGVGRRGHHGTQRQHPDQTPRAIGDVHAVKDMLALAEQPADAVQRLGGCHQRLGVHKFGRHNPPYRTVSIRDR